MLLFAFFAPCLTTSALAAPARVEPALFGIAPRAKENLFKPRAEKTLPAAGNPNLALGVVIMVVGGGATVYNVFAPSSNSEQLDAEDFIQRRPHQRRHRHRPRGSHAHGR